MRIDEISLENLNTASEAEQLAAVQKEGQRLRWIEDPSLAVQLAAVTNQGYAVQYIENPSEAVQIAAVQQYGLAIEVIDNPSLAVQLAAVGNDGSAIQWIENPSLAVQLAAIKNFGWSIICITDPSPELFTNSKAKRIIIKSVLDLIKTGETELVPDIFAYLRDHGVVWPELEVIDPALKESHATIHINELTGYKSHPFYKKARATFDGPPYDRWATNTYRKDKLSRFKEFLEQKGFKFIDRGSFGIVFERPGYPWIFKIFNKDPAYLHFLKYAMAHQGNPHMPKIKGIIKINDDTYAVRMERLSPIPIGTEPAMSLIRKIVGIDSYSDLSDADVAWIDKKFPGISAFFKSFPLGNFEYDLHLQNFMQRGNTMVIVDPIYDYREMQGN